MSTRKRWLANIGLALVLCFVYAVAVAVLSFAANWIAGTPPTISDAVASLLYGLVELPFLVAIPVLVYLAVGELIWPRVQRQRLSSVVLAAAALVAGLLAAQASHLTASRGVLVVTIVLAGAGAVYGSLAWLPGHPPARGIDQR